MPGDHLESKRCRHVLADAPPEDRSHLDNALAKRRDLERRRKALRQGFSTWTDETMAIAGRWDSVSVTLAFTSIGGMVRKTGPCHFRRLSALRHSYRIVSCTSWRAALITLVWQLSCRGPSASRGSQTASVRLLSSPGAGVVMRSHNEPMDAKIRQASVDDAPALAALHLRTALFAYASIFPSDAPLPKLDHLTLDWKQRLGGRHGPNMRGYVAVVGDRLAGVVMAGADPDHLEMGHITRFYVDAPRWGQGIGSLLYEAAISHLRQLGYGQATLWVLEGNARARTWYERLGWTCTGERKVAAKTLGVDDVRYTRPL